MKLLIKHQSLIFIIALPATLFLICLIWFFPHEISMIFLFHWFFLVFIIFLLFHPFSKIYLTQPMNRSDNQMLKFKNLLLTRGWKIILLQICFQILSFEMLYFTTHSLPILNSAKTPNFMEVLRFFNLNEGLFPWLIVILITINFAYSSYIKNQNAYFNTIIQCLVNSSPIEKFGVVCNFIARGITLLAMSSTLLLLALWLVHLFFPHLLAATTGFNLASFALIVTSFIIFVSKSVRNTIKKKFQIKSYFILKLLIIILTLALLITFLTLLYHPLHIVSFKTPGVILSLQNKGTFIFWLLFMNCWWLLWIPVLSISLAFYSDGFKIKNLILLLLVWPCMSSLSLFLFPLSLHQSFDYPEAVHFILGITAFTLIILLVVGKTRFPLLSLCYLSANGDYKPRSQASYLSRILLFIIVILYLYMPAGLWMLTPLYIIFGLTGLVVFIMSIASLTIQVFQLKR